MVSVLRSALFALATSLLLLVHVAQAADDQPNETVLVYEAELPQDLPEGQEFLTLKKLVAAIDRRINTTGANKAADETKIADVSPLEGRRTEIRVPRANSQMIERIERLLSGPGLLEFRILANPSDHPEIIAQAKASKDAVIYQAGQPTNSKPADSKQNDEVARWVSVRQSKDLPLFEDRDVTRMNESGGTEVLVVKDDYDLTGAHIERVTAGFDDRGMPSIDMKFSPRGGKLLENLTRDNLPDDISGRKRRLGILLDGAVITAPSINSVIRDKAQIAGNFTRQAVDDMAQMLNAGTLPVHVKKIEATKAK